MLIVALLGAGLGVLATLYAKDLIEIITPVALTVLLTLFVVAVLLYFAITLYRDKIIRYLFGEDIQFDAALNEAQDIVKQTIVGTTEAIPGIPAAEKKRLQQAAPRVANYLIWSQFRSQGLRLMIGFFVAVGGLATTMLLFNQNRLLEKQNEKIDMQNEKVDMQINLEESNRRSALVFQMANILDKIDEELRDTFNTNHGTRRLSLQLIGRIASLSQGLRPYKYLDSDTLSAPLSPERGQLLIAVHQSKLDISTLDSIFKETTFEFADLGGAQIQDAYLRSANLSSANFANADLRRVDLQHAILENANFNKATLEQVKLNSANLEAANLSQVNNSSGIPVLEDQIFDNISPNHVARIIPSLRIITFDGAILDYVNFRGANLLFCSFSNAMINWSDLRETSLTGVDFTDAKLINTNLAYASLNYTYFHRADLHGANLSGTQIDKASWKEAWLDRVILPKNYCHSEALRTLSKAKSLYRSQGMTESCRNTFREKHPDLFSHTQLGMIKIDRALIFEKNKYKKNN